MWVSGSECGPDSRSGPRAPSLLPTLSSGSPPSAHSPRLRWSQQNAGGASPLSVGMCCWNTQACPHVQPWEQRTGFGDGSPTETVIRKGAD